MSAKHCVGGETSRSACKGVDITKKSKGEDRIAEKKWLGMCTWVQ